ncbi:PstS family phosphate ABC transporter substrate-binding protein [Saccharopolyspora taberi]|uniref:Substrate-binding domain-containing protein n=1 Tax=Saccharopolyspora taberi TaxID=60895 RepID=A0ABN3V6V3_9PSEU
MDGIPWEIIFAVLGVVVPIIAALYEFVFIGRKRLGYRVQMDTTATDVDSSQYAGALQQFPLSENERLIAPSFVLLRIENIGASPIDADDYAAPENVDAGIAVEFPGRRVVGMMVTELSDEFLRDSFRENSGLRVKDNVIELPKVSLNRKQHYKVLAALDRVPDKTGAVRKAQPPKVVGGIKGGVGRGRIRETKNQIGTPRNAVALIGFLVAVILAQVSVSVATQDTPLDCAQGKLTVVGSTAFRPVLDEAAASYVRTCPGAQIEVQATGSTEGLDRLDAAGKQGENPEVVAFSDGMKTDRYPRLLPRPIAFSLFTMVSNKESGVQDLSADRIRQLYAGQITNWNQLNGNDVPVRLVSRYANSGTRRTFEQHLLLGAREPVNTSDDCRDRAPGAAPGAVRCERGSTEDVLNTVATTPGAFGYVEAGAAEQRADVFPVRIDGQPATLEGADQGSYPFWETEYAYTYGEPKAHSLTAGFLRYLVNEVGRDIVRSHRHKPCAELANPMLCRPA